MTTDAGRTTTDKTAGEIAAAIEAGMVVQVRSIQDEACIFETLKMFNVLNGAYRMTTDYNGDPVTYEAASSNDVMSIEME